MVLVAIAILAGALVYLHVRGFRDGAFSDPLLFLTGISLFAYVITKPKRTRVPVAVAICSGLVLFALPAGRTSETDPIGRREIQSGTNAYDAEDFDTAIARFSDAIQLNPRSLEALYARGITYIRLEAHEKAIADFTQAIETDARFADAYRGRGTALFESGDDDNAILDYTEAIRLDANDLDALHNRGLAYHFRGDQDKALADLESCKERGGTVSSELLADVRAALNDGIETSD